MQEILGALAILRRFSPAALDAAPLQRAAAERLLEALVGLAAQVNRTLIGDDPAVNTGGDQATFAAVARAGAIDVALADDLARSVSLRRAILDGRRSVPVEVVADAIPVLLDGYAEYVRQVAAFLER